VRSDAAERSSMGAQELAGALIGLRKMPLLTSLHAVTLNRVRGEPQRNLLNSHDKLREAIVAVYPSPISGIY
jgi:hypothetical protein